ncbi:MAG: hypothetical protein OSA98_05205 [Rubripirellula sp.]|nr:hypothetical protein [Rubripirellula sp.]
MKEMFHRQYTQQRKPQRCPKCKKRTLADILYKDMIRDYISLREREQLFNGDCVIGGRRMVTGTHQQEDGYASWMCRSCGCEVYAGKRTECLVLTAG